jgi:hypothetical protein
MAEGAERAASVKLTLDSGEYLVELKRVGNENKKTADESKKRFDAMGKGIDGAKGALKGMLQTAKDGITTLGTLGGAFSAANALKNAVQLDARFRHLADAASDASGSMVTARDIQTDVARTAALTSRTSDELTGSFEQLIQATGDLKFSRDAMKSVGTAATATGKSVELLTSVAGTLNEKFKVTGDGMDDALATIIGNTDRGGVKLAELAEVGETLGANLLQAGLTGDRGLKFLLGSLNQVEGEMGGMARSAKGVGQLLMNLGKGSELKAMAKDLGIDPAKLVNEKDAIARLTKILSFGEKGLKTLKANFVGPEESKALKLLFTQPFEDALNRAKASGLKGKDAVDQALKVLEGQIGRFGESSVNAATIRERAAKEMESPEANLRRALERLNTAFSEPQIIESINELSKVLPDLAKWMAKLLSFAAKSPLLAGSMAIGGKVGGGFLGGMAQELIKAHLAGAKGGAPSLTDGVIKGAKGGSNLLAAAGTAFGVAAAALIAAEWIKNKAGEDATTTSDLSGATAAASGRMGSRERQKAQADALEKAIAAAEESRSGVGGTVEDVFSGLGGLVTGQMGAASLKDQQIRESKKVLADKRQRIAEMVENPRRGGEAGAERSAAGAGTKVTLDPGSPRQIGVAVADALGGRTVVAVRVVGGTGVPAAPGRLGGKGPLQVPSAQPGGGY